MKKYSIRFLSILLSVLTVLMSLPLTAFASAIEAIDDTQEKTSSSSIVTDTYLSDGNLNYYSVDTDTTRGEVDYSYDTYGRLTSKIYDYYVSANTSNRYTNTVSYTFSKYGSTRTSAQVAAFTSKVNDYTAVTSTYTYIPIEQVALGNYVWATNPATNETELKEVVNLYVKETTVLIHIKYDDQELITTPNHPFWVPNKGWVMAIDLIEGDCLQKLDGSYTTIFDLSIEHLRSPVLVYNFEVHDFHTYYVTDKEILVHNDCSGQPTPKTHPDSFQKMRGNQGYKDSEGNFWKVDRLHKDHYDVVNSKGVKVKEVDFYGRQIWPDGPKNKNK